MHQKNPDSFYFSFSMKSALDRCSNRKSIAAFPESLDIRVLEATDFLLKNRIVDKVCLFAAKEQTLDFANQYEVNIAKYKEQIIWFAETYSHLKKDLAVFLIKQQSSKGKKFTDEDLQDMVASPLYQAAYLLRLDKCNVVLAGCVHKTAEVIKAGLRVVGLSAKTDTVSGSFFMEKEDELYLFADCGVVVQPTIEQLVDIASESVKTWNTLSSSVEHKERSPALAFLSFSTKNSANHLQAKKISEAARIFRSKFPQVLCDGELQFDAAFDPQICQVKAPGSPLDRPANIFIFPNLDAGNIGYKIAQRIGGLKAYGPILQGLNKPFSDVSRGASVKDLIVSTAINLLRS